MEIDPKGMLRCSQINLISPLKICKLIIPILLKREKRSALINMSSCTGYLISARVGVYSMTKKMLDIYTQNL
jgi:short-subunit dehydrogenase